MHLRSLILLILLLLLATACGSDQPDVTFVVFGDPAERQAYESLVAAFEQRHPQIDVLLSHVPDQGDYRRRLAADFSAGAAPDVFLLNYRRFANFAAQGGLVPLEDYLESSEIIAREDFFPIAIESFVWDDQLWCIPQNISSLVVYYNKSLFEQFNVPLPADDWTRDDFLAAAQALTQDTDGDGQVDIYGAGIAPNIFRLAPFIWADGGDIVDDRQNPTRLTLDDPRALQAFRWFVALQTEHGVVPDATAESAESSESRFLNNRLAMYFNSRRGVPTYRTIEDFEWDVAPLPRGERAAGILHSDAYCLAETAGNKDAAWTFIEFANSEEGQQLIAASGRTVPSLISVADSPVFLDPSQPPANSRVYVDTVDVLGVVPIMPGWVGIEETASKEIERAFYGNAGVEEAAQTADELTGQYFENDGN